MKVLIVAKTRRGSGACVGGLTFEAKSIRLMAPDAEEDPRAGMEFEVGEVWEIDAMPEPMPTAPHTENVTVLSKRRLSRCDNALELIGQWMPPLRGGPEVLFDGLTVAAPSGALFISQATGVPTFSTMFWQPDQPLYRDLRGKRIHYCYESSGGLRTLAFVGFQEPMEVIPEETVLRVSLAHWWRPKDKPEEALRCYVQLSGWFLTAPEPHIQVARTPTLQSKQASDETTGAAAEAVLKRVFGYDDFRPLQREIIERVLAGRDALAVMPTGGGKSLCYQLPSLMRDGLTVVVSPLIALMKDQVDQLRELGIAAEFLNSSMSHPDYVRAAERVRSGESKLLYVAPESLLRPETLLLLEEGRLCCLAIDEAHCISSWGYDFRPEYRQLMEVRSRFPGVGCIALTATATPRVRDDVRQILNFESQGEFVASFNRENLFLSVRPRTDGLAQVHGFLERHRDQSGIIYCSTRKQVEILTAQLEANTWSALPYHAGLDDETRRNNQERFVRDDVPIIVATIAFGMGINKSNVRFVIHYNLPKNIESYYQEIGRAGRDGLPADCLLLYSRQDAITIRRFIEQGAPSERAGSQARLEAMMRYAETEECRRVPLLAYFGEQASESCQTCDRCTAIKEDHKKTDVTIAAQKFLSCVKRTNQKFGVGHVIDVLRGSKSKKVRSWGHDLLSTYGIGLEHSARQWRQLANQFLTQGLMDQDMEVGSIRLTQKAWQVFKGEKVFATLENEEAAPVDESHAQADCDQVLFAALRDQRRQLAVAGNVPPYVIFSDRALVEMASFYPQTESQFLAINGVGQAKLEKYGSQFLGVIQRYCDERGIDARPKRGLVDSQPQPVSRSKRRYEEVGELFEAGRGIEELQRMYQVKQQTIVNHLFHYVQAGHRIDGSRILEASALTPQRRADVLEAFSQAGPEMLAPVYARFHGNISYEELALVRLAYVCEQRIGEVE